MSKKAAGNGAAPQPVPLGVAPALGGNDGGNAPIPIIKFDDDKDGQRDRKLATRKEINKRGGSSARTSKKAKAGFFALLTSLVFQAGVAYLLVGAFWSCPATWGHTDYDLNDSRATCRTLAQAKSQIAPVVTPYYHAAQAKVEPYTKPYVDAAYPYYRTAHKTALPYYKTANKLSRKYYKTANQLGRKYYNRNIEPLRKRAVKRSQAFADPHVKVAQQHYSKHVEPHVVAARKAAKPYQDIYRRDVAPVLNDAYLQSLAAGTGAYKAYNKHAHPLVLSSAKQGHSFYVNHFDPAVRRTYALYIRPQADKVLQKIFDWKAHAMSSEAIKDAKRWAKLAKKEAKAVEDEKVAEAKASAAHAMNDPSVLDRINIAKDQVTGGPLAAADPAASAVSDAEEAAELTSTQEQLEAWEKGLAALIDEEHKLVQTRFDEIHARFAETVPEKFDVLTEDVEMEVDGVFAQLAKSFQKLAKQEEGSERTEAGKTLVEKQHGKLSRSRERAVRSLGGLFGELEAEENATQRASVEEVERFIAEATKAHRSLIKSATSEKTREQFSTWDEGIVSRAQTFSQELDSLKTGNKKLTRGVVGVSGGKKGDIQRRIGTLQSSLEGLYDTALAELGAFGAKELSALGAAGAAASVLESIVGGTKQLSEDAQNVIKDAAGSLGGSGSGAASLVSAKASEASASASSLLREGAKSVGVSVDPETPGEYVESVYEAAKSAIPGSGSATGRAYASEASASASSLVREGAKSVGIKVDPETPGEYVESAYEAAKSAMPDTASASSFASEASASASSLLREGAKSVGIKVNPETPGEYIESVYDAVTSGVPGSASASSLASEASASASSLLREGAKSVGIKVNPETPGEYVESVYDAARSAVAGTPTASGSPIISSASSIGSEYYVSASSIARQAAQRAGVQFEPESSGEMIESIVSEIYSSGSSIGSVASSVASSAASNVAGKVPVDFDTSQASKIASAASVGMSSSATALGSAASSVARSAAQAAGLRVQPESPGEYIESVAGLATDGAASLAGEASSVLHQATRSLASAVGVEATPETPGEYVESVLEAAQGVGSDVAGAAGSVYSRRGRVVSSASSVVQEAGSSASSLAAQVSSSASSLAPGAGSSASSLASQASKSASSLSSDASSSASSLSRRGRVVLGSSSAEGAVGSAASSASSLLSSLGSSGSEVIHQATRSASSALGASPSPESAGEYVDAAVQGVKSVVDRVREEL